MRTFIERRGKGQRHALQIAVHGHLRVARPKPEYGGVGRAARGALCQTRHHAQLFGLPQAVGGSRPAGTQNNRRPRPIRRHDGTRRRYRAALQPHVAPQHPSLRTRHGKPFFGESHHASRTTQLGRVRRDLKIIAPQNDAALHRGVAQLENGQTKFEGVICTATGHRASQYITNQATQRGAIHDAQSLRQRAPGFGADIHCGVVQISNLGVDVAQLQPTHGARFGLPTFEFQLHPVNHQ